MSGRQILKKTAKIIDIASDIAGYMGAVAVLASAIILTLEVLSRYLFNTPTIWEIEASVFLLIFAGFVGAAYGLKHEAHINIELLTVRLNPRSRLFLSIITSVVSLLFCLAVVYRAWPMWWEAYELGWRSESLWGPPLWIPYLFLPVGFTLLSFQYAVYIANLMAKLRTSPEEKTVTKDRPASLNGER